MWVSVLGDKVWTGDGLNLNASRPLYLSLLWYFFSSACIVLQFSLAYITLRGGLQRGPVRIGWYNIWTGREIFERVCVKKKNTKKIQKKIQKKKGKKKENTTFYILPLVNIWVLNLVLAGLLSVHIWKTTFVILFNQQILGSYVSALPH